MMAQPHLLTSTANPLYTRLSNLKTPTTELIEVQRLTCTLKLDLSIYQQSVRYPTEASAH